MSKKLEVTLNTLEHTQTLIQQMKSVAFPAKDGKSTVRLMQDALAGADQSARNHVLLIMQIESCVNVAVNDLAEDVNLTRQAKCQALWGPGNY